MRAAVLDLGSNSFHVLVADLDGHRIAPVLRQREMRHLGRVVRRHGFVPDDEVATSAATVAHLAELARRAGAQELIAVATAALRDAGNGAQVLRALSEAGEVEIRVVDGLEEARLAYLGVRAAVAVDAEPVLVLDLGGGSLEFAVGAGSVVEWAASTPLGASALSTEVPEGVLRPKHLRRLERLVDDAVTDLVAPIRDAAPATSIAVGGTVRALGRVLAAAHATWLPATVNQLRIGHDELAALADDLASRTLEERTEVPGVSSRRADHLHVAAVVLARVLDRLELDAVLVSDWGLREGVLLDAHGVSDPPTPEALRDSEVERIRTTFAPDDPHPGHVAALAGMLFDATGDLHGLPASWRELLTSAARLHAIGESIALRKQQRHGAYLVDNAELRGFSPAESAMLTTLVRFHPSRGVSRHFPAYAALSAEDQDRTQSLLALLQVADGLDRAHDQAVTGLHVERDGDTLVLELLGDALPVAPLELDRRTRLFTERFGVEVEVRDRGDRHDGGRDAALRGSDAVGPPAGGS
ncbi:MAG: Ppx/GppA family phosphatase [Nitriliruptoraceae bacterium]|nr:Ppx/GppA family phosphatase [Nitriliruptoraceae bacterium]